MIIKLSR